MKFSVIVPCYNVEAYLDQCIESIIVQDYRDFEVILVDDGSKDGTGTKCDEWELIDKRVRTFHKPNGGLSDARNYGMAQAQGEYLIFIDSDDFIDNGAFRELAIATESYPDVILTRLIEYYGENDVSYNDTEMEIKLRKAPSVQEAVMWETNYSNNSWPAPKKIVRRQFVEDNNMCFLKGFLHEDVDWSTRILLTAKTYVSCPIPWYYHRMKREGSITNTIKAKSITDVIEMAAVLCPMCEKSDAVYSEQIADRVLNSVFTSINKIDKLAKSDRNIVVKSITENMAIFKNAKKIHHKLFVACMRIFGVKAACNLICIIK